MSQEEIIKAMLNRVYARLNQELQSLQDVILSEINKAAAEAFTALNKISAIAQTELPKE